MSHYKSIDINNLTTLTQNLVQIPTVNPPGNEKDLAEFLTLKLQELGFQVKNYDVDIGRPNVVGLLQGKVGKKTLMFNGHMDVVPPGNEYLWTHDPFSGHKEDNRIYGRGACDMKGGIASIITSIKTIIDSNIDLNDNLLVTFVIDEETTGNGTKNIIKNGYKANYAVIAEPTELIPLRGHKGVLWMEIQTLGTSEHSSLVKSTNPKIGDNAIYHMNKIISKIENLLPDLEKKQNILLGNPTISLGTIIGGTKTNTVPDLCTITVDRRLIPGEKHVKVKQEIDTLISHIQTQNSNFKVNNKTIIERDSVEIPENEEIIQICKNATSQVLGFDSPVSGCVGTTDMAILVNEGQIPTCILGPGRINECHIINEYIEIDQLINATKIYCNIILNTIC